jgi:hypothetical protein
MQLRKRLQEKGTQYADGVLEALLSPNVSQKCYKFVTVRDRRTLAAKTDIEPIAFGTIAMLRQRLLTPICHILRI